MRGGRLIGARKRCLRCHQRGVANANKLCEACKAAGWRWCSVGKHCAPVEAMLSVKHGCRACNQAQLVARRYGTALQPPPGYVSVAEAARRMHYSHTMVRLFATTGRLRSWRRSPTGQLWIDPASLEGYTSYES